MNTNISIIVPIYNTGEYLRECINSILNQSLKNIEVICINDGSKDNSAEIIKGFKKKDSRIKYIEQPNQGLSAARNKGISESQSEYIMFIDSDDYISKNCIRLSFETAEKNGADIVLFNSTREKLDEAIDLTINFFNKYKE